MKKVILFVAVLLVAIIGGCKQKPAAPGNLKLISAAPKTFSNDHDEVLTVHGEGITKDTSFFIQSNKLDVKSTTAREAKVVVPSGFLPATYGLMATRPDGQRSVLYPAITITKGEEEQTNPREHPRSFVEGIVIDYETKEPIQGARITAVGLHTVTDSNGYFLVWGVPPGRVPVRIEAEGYEPVYRYAEVSGGPQTVTVKLAELEKVDTHVTTIGPKGGIHHANNGAYLVVPEGALDEDVNIRFTFLRGPNTLPELAENGYYLAFAHLEPAGLVFKKPATLFLPIPTEADIKPGTDINIFYFDARQGKWVDDVTAGKIRVIDGKKYLVYEINHFTWIGGVPPAPPIPIRGCVDFGEGNAPAQHVFTDIGVTDENGMVSGSISKPAIGTEISLAAYFQDDYYMSEPLVYDGSGEIVFPECVHIPWDVYYPDPEPFPGVGLNPDGFGACPEEAGSTHEASQVGGYVISTQVVALPTSPLPPLLSQINGLTLDSNIRSFQAIDPSTIRILVNGQDQSDNLSNSRLMPGQNQLRELTWDLQKGALGESRDANTIEISYKAKNGITYSHSADVDLPAKYAIAPILLFPVRHDEDSWLGLDSTLLDELPAVSFTNNIVTVVYEEGQPIHDLHLLLPVYALKSGSDNFELAPVNATNVYLTYGPDNQAVTGEGDMKGGVALLPVTIDTDDPENYQFHFSGIGQRKQSGDSADTVGVQQTTFAPGVPWAPASMLELAFLSPEVALVAVIAIEMYHGAQELHDDYHEWADPYVRAIAEESNDIDRLITLMIASGDIVVSPADEPDSTCWDQIGILNYATNTHAGEPVAYAPATDTAEYLDKCTPKPEFRSGQRPEQDHSVYDQRTPERQRYLRNQASKAIKMRWLKEMEFACRFGRGTRNWDIEELRLLKEGAQIVKAAASESQGIKEAFNFLREKGIYGRNGRYVGHHINSKACFEAEAGNANNIELIKREDHQYCHGGDYRQCSKGDTLKSFDEIADQLKQEADGFDDIANCPTFPY